MAGLTPVQKILYDHDIKEYHAPPGNLNGESYRRRFSLMFDAIISRLPVGARILDVGVAQGNLSLLLAENGYQVTATDLRGEFLDYARMKYEKGNIIFREGSFSEIDYEYEFDAVILGEIIEHVAYPEELLANCRRFLKPGGLLLLSTPNGSALMISLPTFFNIGDRKELEAHQFQPDSDGHLFLFTDGELRTLLIASGFTVSEITYWGSPFLSGKFKVRYLARHFPWSLISNFERLITSLPGIRKFFSAGLVCVARKS